MALKIIVCVKPVPASSSVSIDPVTKTVRREAGETVISTLDKHALELAAQLKKQTDCSVTILTMAPASAEMNVREALALSLQKRSAWPLKMLWNYPRSSQAKAVCLPPDGLPKKALRTYIPQILQG